MVAFAGNSLLCRDALSTEGMDAASFTTLRLTAGAAVLYTLARARGAPLRAHGSWRGTCFLLLYALAFAVAYRTLQAGTGALILFASVQLTMMGVAWRSGERLRRRARFGFLFAAGGLVCLLWPDATAPDLLGALLMGVAGASWGAYSLLGRSAETPLLVTAGNFCRATPIAGALWALALLTERAQSPDEWSATAMGLALASGGVTSGLGYALWYRALRDLQVSTAAIAQLSVPAIAMLGGVVLLEEPFSARTMASAVLTLSGIALATLPPATPMPTQ
jgi:drug/metabolite transporter (DMT)-like permease